MTQYAVLVYQPAPADPADLPKEEMDAHSAQADLVRRMGGEIVAAYGLQPTTTATSIRGDVVTDGPFIEAKEVVAGMYILEARDFDHALEMAKTNPATWHAGVEIRPLFGE
jgi:hypothetical protein